MELDLRLREIKLPGGVMLRCRPMTLGQNQALLALVGRNADLRGMLTSAADTGVILGILAECVVNVEGVSVREPDGSTRAGTIKDFALTGGLGALSLLVQAVIELAKSSSLSGADLGNSLAQPTPALPEPASTPKPS